MTANNTQQATVAQLFDQLADSYDCAALRFFPFTADQLARRLAPQPGEKILDVATGTGAVAVAVAQRLQGGRVIGVDFSERMLDRAYANVRRMALHNIDLHPMDATALEFRADYFDALTCSFGLFFLSDMSAALREWRRVLRPGGRILLTSFAASAFQPLVQLYCDQLAAQCGSQLAVADLPWQRLADTDVFRELLADAGFETIEFAEQQLGFHMQATPEWWDVLWNTGFRGPLLGLEAGQLELFRQQHLARVAEEFRDGTCWLDVPVIFASARVST
ncbi:MAG: class I SAM-dependent methyltransferase [Gammaproteobacteria bacterium]|nr:class I SAM-dependent methyltransferase [Gammaproteobacteria bacterium]